MFPFSSRFIPFYFSFVLPFLSRFWGISLWLVFKLRDKASLLVPMSITLGEAVWFHRLGRNVKNLVNLRARWFEDRDEILRSGVSGALT
jgi:hypothetical protein